MRPSSSDRFLSLIQSALETIVKPELKSDVARQTADIMMLCLAELRRREHGTVDVLEAANREGAAIAAEMRTLLASRGIALEHPAAPAVANSHTPLDGQIAAHQAVTAELCALMAPLQGLPTKAASALMLRAARWEARLHCEQLPMAESSPVGKPYRPPSDGDLRNAIEAFIRTKHADGAAVAITSFTRVTGGFSKTSYLLTLRNGSGKEEHLVVRKMGRKPLIAFEACLIDNEFHLLSDVAKTDFPVAKPLWLGTGVPGVDSDFYVMTRLPGQTIGTFLGGAEKLPERYLHDLAELLAKLHHYPLETFSAYIDRYGNRAVLTDNVADWYRCRIAEWRRYATGTDAVHHLPSPLLAYILAWLEANVPDDTRRPVLIHGDYNIHNFLCANDRVTGVLDWENAMFGAPEQDLAYLKPHIEAHIDWDRFVQHYRDNGGRAVNAAAFDFYQAFNAMRISFGSNRAVKNLQTGAMNDIRLAMIEFGFLPEFMRVSLAHAEAYARQRGQ